MEAIRALLLPLCVKEVSSFVGMCSYYCWFIPNFAPIAKPIIDLTKKVAHFKRTDIHLQAFDFIMESLTTVPFLVYPDPYASYTLYTDASDTCIWACLTQKWENAEKNLYITSPTN